jgi:hypothetical protein
VQCLENLKEEDIEPVCDGCPVDEWDNLTIKLLQLYDRCCLWGDLDTSLIEKQMDDIRIAGRDRRLARKAIVTMHRTVKEFYKEQAPQPEG